MQNTTRKQRRKVSAQLRRRAESIINNAKAYDADTRPAVKRALESGDPDNLLAVVRAAEDPNTLAVLDLTGFEDEPSERVERDAAYAALARHLSAVMRNPYTPTRLFNAIGEEICDMSSDIDYHTPEMIERSITAYERREAQRQKGRAR